MPGVQVQLVSTWYLRVRTYPAHRIGVVWIQVGLAQGRLTEVRGKGRGVEWGEVASRAPDGWDESRRFVNVSRRAAAGGEGTEQKQDRVSRMGPTGWAQDGQSWRIAAQPPTLPTSAPLTYY